MSAYTITNLGRVEDAALAGAEIIAFVAGTNAAAAEMAHGWWSD